ncbi:alanine racemase [Sneathiella sp.]|uniref:alanine racemase n=1 Tax=Sneathiella sp. TaxID=1964365 RepID=UPI002618EEA2|nr:alanine racemase [Sneathiella sp.]MDF2368086.1 alanine racemase [Sneathiella sp.]
MDPKLAGAHLTIDLAALKENYRLLRDQAAPAECAASVKANAYGLGIERVGPALYEAGCRRFFVALPGEGVTLRALLPDAAIHILGGILPETEEVYVAHNLVPVLNSLHDIRQWAAYATDHGPLHALLHLDTGITRLGLLEAEIRELAATPELLENIKIDFVMSHLACADMPDNPMNREQLEKLHFFRSILPEALRETPVSFANSAGIFLGAEFHFDMVRPGIALFGGNPRASTANPMREVVRLRGRILQVQDVDSEIPVGYGATFRTEGSSRIATVSVGYADGYFRALGNKAECAVKTIKVPVVGRVSMDIITIDVSKVPAEDCQPGAFVDLIGGAVPLDEVAAHAETIPYEILTSLGNRYYREYLDAAV